MNAGRVAAWMIACLPYVFTACQGYGAPSGPDADGAQDGQGDTDGGDRSDLSNHPATCAQRGGECTPVAGGSAPCPAGSYDPFSGELRFCAAASTLCCVPTGGLGSTCSYDDPCDDGSCLAESSGYPPGGLCAGVCDPAAAVPGCPAWAVCIPVFFSQALGHCMIRCGQESECRQGWSCQAFPRRTWGEDRHTVNVCWARGIQMGMKALTESCGRDEDCLSMLCREAPDGITRCSATCDDGPCLPGSTCRTTSGESLCF
jgi:hypothetical protein